MKVKLPFGRTFIDVEMPDDAVILEHDSVPGLKNEKDKVMESLKKPINSLPLREVIKKNGTVAIVISDITRPTPNHKIIPWIIEELKDISLKNFIIINGTGTHRENTDAELSEMLGVDVVNSIRIINHDAFKKSGLKYLGRCNSGAEVFLNREFCEADFKIVTGFIEPHFFAGFSGGPKGIMPGIAGIDTIAHFHSAKLIAHPNSTWGLVEENLIQQEAKEIALMSKPDFMLNVTLNQNKEITNVFAGEMIAAHMFGTRYVKKHSMIACDEPFDIVVTTNSGYPLDQNLYQAVKGMSAARQIVKKGGAIICVAECGEGIPDHGNFRKIFNMKDSPREILKMIHKPDFSMSDQWQVQKLAMIQIWADVYLYSKLEAAEVSRTHIHFVKSIEDTMMALAQKHGKSSRIAVIPQGPLSIPYIVGEEARSVPLRES
ncbi:nickel-dependent lactate racemase [bacterium]|nr:nickel-dependent lactate racemase [bacterium]